MSDINPQIKAPTQEFKRLANPHLAKKKEAAKLAEEKKKERDEKLEIERNNKEVHVSFLLNL